jgi:phospholipid/cholesterol/gamma-HCH transport system substrate-binding protein
MSERRQQIQVGILFIASLALLIMGVLWFKEFSIGKKTYLVTAEFPSTSGLAKGDPVEVKGVPSGKVEDIRFEDGKALATLQIAAHVQLHQGAFAAIDNVSLMGQKVVSVNPGSQKLAVLPPGTILRGFYRGGIPELLSGVGTALGTFERLASRVDSLLVAFDEDRQAQLTRTLDNVERATGELADLLAANRTAIAEAITSMNLAMNDVHEMVGGHAEQFSNTLEDASRAAGRLDSTLTNLDRTVTRVDSLLARVQSGEGTLGKVMADDQLYDQLVVTLKDAKDLLQDVRAHPKRYFKFSVF